MPALTRNDAVRMLNKVPEVTLYFWIIKILATTVGETGADFLSVKLGFGLNGASIGDLLSQHQADGGLGLGLGTMGTSALFLTVITALVVFMTVRANGSATQPEMAGD